MSRLRKRMNDRGGNQSETRRSEITVAAIDGTTTKEHGRRGVGRREGRRRSTVTTSMSSFRQSSSSRRRLRSPSLVGERQLQGIVSFSLVLLSSTGGRGRRTEDDSDDSTDDDDENGCANLFVSTKGGWKKVVEKCQRRLNVEMCGRLRTR